MDAPAPWNPGSSTEAGVEAGAASGVETSPEADVEVAVKVQRAGLKELFDTDLKNLKVLVKLLDKFDRTCELLMQLICERGRTHAAEVAAEFAKMYEMMQDQPKDIERLTEISKNMDEVFSR